MAVMQLETANEQLPIMDELKKKKIAVLPIENLSMMREINIVYSQDFEHFETLRDIVRSYNETRGVVGDRK